MPPEFFTRADLLAGGGTRRSIQGAVRRGDLIHVRRDRYLPGTAHEQFARAVRVGGRLTCLSLLAMLGVFVLENRNLHVHVLSNSSRLRFTGRARARFDTARRRVRLHWGSLLEAAGSSSAVNVLDALAHAVRCQPPRAAIATIDSALYQGFILEAQLADLFAALPARFRPLLPLIDGRAESGPESLVRLMARMLGCDIRLQVEFDGVGRVDLVLDGWLVVECDSKEFHASWEAQLRDRERDLALAAMGYCTIRLTAATIMYRPDEAFAALKGLIRSRRP
jgi:very-short-patch-repair endonuclease